MNGTKLFLTFAQRRKMELHIQACLPEEACGLAGGRGQRLEMILPVTNRLHSPVRFEMEPVEMLQAFERFEATGMELAAIFHSHPKGPPVPSETDLASFFYPGVAYLIWAPEGVEWQVRGFIIENARVTELEFVYGVTTHE
jgi:[CysO sulfur-carrier protein]-S-L-cysteine hydrolase